jgi:energy-converting hydrogenase B subunit D
MSWDASFLWQFDILLLLMVLILAIAALSTKDLVAAAVIFGAYSFIMCLLWTEMLAVDVAFTEAAVGAGVSTVLVLGTALHIKRKSKD